MEWSARRCLSLLVLWSTAGSLATAAPVRVGVVLDLTSDAGRKSLSCISAALDGFCLKHASCTKLVELRVRDSRGEAVKAAQAGLLLVHDLSTAILNITGGDEGSRIQTKLFAHPLSSEAGDGSSDPNSTQISLQSVAGAFVITGAVSTLMLLVSIGRLVHASRTSGRIADVESVNDDGGASVGQDSLHLENGSICHNDAASDHPLCEAVNSESHVRVENAGGQEACLVQQNGLHGGSVTTESIQIEMRTV